MPKETEYGHQATSKSSRNYFSLVMILVWALIIVTIGYKSWPVLTASIDGSESSTAFNGKEGAVGYLVYDVGQWLPRGGITLTEEQRDILVRASREAVYSARDQGFIVLKSEAVDLAPDSAYVRPGMFGTEAILPIINGESNGS